MSKEMRSNSSAVPETESASLKMQRLVGKSLDVMEGMLTDDTLSAQERFNIASKIIEMSAAWPSSTGALETKAKTAAPSPPAQKKPSTIVPIHCIQVDNFLTPDELEQLLQISQENESGFQASLVNTKTGSEVRPSTRQSMVLQERSVPEFGEFFKEKLMDYLPLACEQLKFSLFTPSRIALQLTAHNDGDYYIMHSDVGIHKTADRKITYVYYYYKEPKAFAGGELRLYDTEIVNNRAVKRTQYLDVEPRNNRIIFFNSRLLHEVKTTHCESKQFADSRFTVNGWISHKQ